MCVRVWLKFTVSFSVLIFNVTFISCVAVLKTSPRVMPQIMYSISRYSQNMFKMLIVEIAEQQLYFDRLQDFRVQLFVV